MGSPYSYEVSWLVIDSKGKEHRGTMFGPNMPIGCAFEIDYQCSTGRFPFDWDRITIWNNLDELVYEVEQSWFVQNHPKVPAAQYVEPVGSV